MNVMKKIGKCLLLIILIFIEFANFNDTTSTKFCKDGKTLYVGGSGPGNYTSIQTAIDNASDGDTIFVYDDSSPYYESIVINKSIALIGENRYTTVIKADYENTINIIADNVKISNFTILGNKNACISIRANKTNITKNIVNGGFCGISIYGYKNILCLNCIRNSEIGVRCEGNHTIIVKNNLTNNSLAIHILRGRKIFGGFNEIHSNNFISNELHALFSWCCGIFLFDIRNVANWNGNYWDNWCYCLPKPIIGFIFVINTYSPQFILPNFDWTPSLKPIKWWKKLLF